MRTAYVLTNVTVNEKTTVDLIELQADDHFISVRIPGMMRGGLHIEGSLDDLDRIAREIREAIALARVQEETEVGA